jgi:hypothetical protein
MLFTLSHIQIRVEGYGIYENIIYSTVAGLAQRNFVLGVVHCKSLENGGPMTSILPDEV